MSFPPGSEPDRPDETGSSAPADPWVSPPPGRSDDASHDRSAGPEPAPYGQPAYGQPAYGQPAYGQPGYGHSPYGALAAPTNAKAQVALWSGVTLLVLSCCALGVFGVVPVVLGVQARNEIRASAGQQSGDGLALTGIVTGALAVVLSLVLIAVVVIVVLGARSAFESYGTTSV